MKIVINKCFGGFGLSQKAMEWMVSNGCKAEWSGEISRDDPLLIKCVEKFGEAASGELSKLKVVEIPDGISWHINDYDGMETIHEDHDVWG